MLRLVSVLGLVAFLGIAWLMSENRRAIPWRLLGWGLGLQFILAILILRTGLGEPFFAGVDAVVGVLTDATMEGAEFVFGPTVTGAEGGGVAFQVLPVIIFVASLSAILYHLRIIQLLVRGVAYLMRRTLKTSGAETFGAALLIFLGIESTTAVRGYLHGMTRSELCTLMTTFMGTIAGSVMVVYATFGAEPGHLVAASLMSAPAAILISKIMVPETGEPQTQDGAAIDVPVESHNVVDAAAQGAQEGLKLALNIATMLIAFIGLVYLINMGFDAVIGVTFTGIMGYVFMPFALLMGVPWHDAATVGELLGTKTVLNEFLAYAALQDLVGPNGLDPRSAAIATYALCGFANPGSLGILIAGVTALIPERRVEVVQLGLKSFVGGTLAAFTTASIAGLLLHG